MAFTQEQKIARERAALDAKEALLKWQPKTNHTDAEKIAAFDVMHKFAMNYVHALKNNERFKDAKHYAYELMMEQTVANTVDGKDLWTFRNGIDYDWEG